MTEEKDGKSGASGNSFQTKAQRKMARDDCWRNAIGIARRNIARLAIDSGIESPLAEGLPDIALYVLSSALQDAMRENAGISPTGGNEVIAADGMLSHFNNVLRSYIFAQGQLPAPAPAGILGIIPPSADEGTPLLCMSVLRSDAQTAKKEGYPDGSPPPRGKLIRTGGVLSDDDKSEAFVLLVPLSEEALSPRFCDAADIPALLRRLADSIEKYPGVLRGEPGEPST